MWVLELGEPCLSPGDMGSKFAPLSQFPTILPYPHIVESPNEKEHLSSTLVSVRWLRFIRTFHGKRLFVTKGYLLIRIFLLMI